MDRTYVTQQQRTPVYALGLELWRDVVVRSRGVAPRLQSILLDLISKERLGETVDRGLLRSTTQVRV
jgi:cullin 3